MPKTYAEKRRLALRSADLWLQEMVRRGEILSDPDVIQVREWVRRINAWSNVLIEHDMSETQRRLSIAK